MVRYVYDMYDLEAEYTETLIQTGLNIGSLTEYAYEQYSSDGLYFITTGSYTPFVGSGTSYRTADNITGLRNSLVNHSADITAGRYLAKIRRVRISLVADVYEMMPSYSRGAFLQQFVSSEEEEEMNVYPENGPIPEIGLWFIRREIYVPYPKVKAGGQIRDFEKAMVKVSGSLREVDKIWTKVENEVKEV